MHMMTATSYQVVNRPIATRTVATMRARIPVATIGTAIGAGFVEVTRAVEMAGAEIDGLPFAIYHRFDPQEADVELGFPVLGKVDVGRVHTAVLEGGHVVCTFRMGPYEEVEVLLPVEAHPAT